MNKSFFGYHKTNNCINNTNERCNKKLECQNKEKCYKCIISIPGATGPTGTAGTNGVLNFADFYALMPPDNADTVALGTDVSFLQNSPIKWYRNIKSRR